MLTQQGYPINYPALKTRDKLYEGALSYLQGIEEKLARASEVSDPNVSVGLKLPVSAGDVTYLIEELYRGRSVVSSVPTKLVLVRWQRPEGPVLKRIGSGADEQKSVEIRLRDIVCMTKEEASRHYERVLKAGEGLEAVYDAEVIARVEERLVQAAEAEKYRI